MSYNYYEVENKLLMKHINKNTYRLVKDNLRPKKYIMCLSNDDKTKVISDIYARLYRMKGYNVLYSLEKTQYDDFGLSIDHKREIDREYFEESFGKIQEKIASQNIIFEETVLKKRILEYFEKLNIEPKKREDFIYNNKLGYLVKLDFFDELKSIEVFIDNCAFIYGATFLKVSCYYKNIHEFVFEDEMNEFKEFLVSEDEFFYSGSRVINPFNNEIIPVFIVKKMKDDFQFGIPDIFEEDYNFAYKNDIEIKKIYKNNYMCNTGFVDKMDIQTANKVVYDEYYPKNIVKFLEKYNFEDLIKNNLKYNNKELKSAYYYYYITYLNNLYNEEKKYKDLLEFFDNHLIFIEKEDNNKLNYLILLDILVNFSKEKPFIVQNIYVNKKNNKTIDLDTHSKDVSRLYMISNEDSIDEVYEIIYDIWKINFINILDEDNLEINKIYNYFIEDMLERYNLKDFNNICVIIRNFLNVLLSIKKISYKQLKQLLMILHPLIPYITEEMYMNIFNSYETLSFEIWPWEEE